MQVQSTRGGSGADCREAVLKGLAPDGGLYVDDSLRERFFGGAIPLVIQRKTFQFSILSFQFISYFCRSIFTDFV